MQVPASIYGPFREVKRRTGRLLPKMKHGASFEVALGADRLIDTAEHEGLILLLPTSLNPRRQDYHPEFALANVLGGIADGILPRETEETVFNTGLGSAWGVLLLLPHSLSYWVKPEHRWIPFLRAATRFWPVLEAEGARYWNGGFYSGALAESVTTINFVLGRAGIYLTGVDRPLPPNWPALVEAYAERRKQELH